MTFFLCAAAGGDVGALTPQHAWLQDMNRELTALATRLKLGRSSAAGIVPLDPVLQWEEQLITDDDVWAHHVANAATVKAFELIAARLDDQKTWERP